MKLSKALLTVALATSVAAPALAYDASLADRILNTVTGQMNRQFFMTKPCKIEAKDVLAMLAKKEPVTLLDIRTPEERSVVAVSYPGAMSISMDDLFKKENLDRLPKTGKIIVICHSGNRAAGATALLKSVGFDDVVYVNGGLISMVTNLTPMNSPSN